MAKFETFTTTEKYSSSAAHEGSAELTVLFEIGDIPEDVMLDTQRLLDNHVANEEVGGGTPTSDGVITYLEQLPRDNVTSLLVTYWTSQMNTMGNKKYAYANTLRDAVNQAQNSSN